MALTSLLIAAVVGQARPSPLVDAKPDERPSTSVPTYLTVTLSAPARSIRLEEPSGRLIEIPATNDLSLAADLELNVIENLFEAKLSIDWQDPAGSKFIRLEFEPDNLPRRELLFHFTGDVSDHSITLDWSSPSN